MLNLYRRKEFKTILLILSQFKIVSPINNEAKLILISSKGKRQEISANSCQGGVFLSNPTTYKCICVNGVWGIYGEFCEKPIAVIGGENVCFRVPPNIKIRQFITFGNPYFPFMPSITHFREDFKLSTGSYENDRDELDIDAASSFLTIINHKWELKSENSEKICLNGNESSSGAKKYCIFRNENWTNSQLTPWSIIDSIYKNCKSGTNELFPNSCVNLISNSAFPSPIEKCTGPMLTLFGKEEDFKQATTTTKEPPLIDFENITTPTTPTTTTTEKEITLDFKENNEIIPPTPPPSNEFCIKGITRSDVQNYWEAQNKESCNSNGDDPIFYDQLKRIAIKRMNLIFNERSRSLAQMEDLIKLSKELMRANCPKEGISSLFLNEVTEAFIMLINEDFFYRTQDIEEKGFKRIKLSLEKCVQNAQRFNISFIERNCGVYELTGKLYLGENLKYLTIPSESASENFEPIIESVWKMLLNAHAYCYGDFLSPNDHHLFSVQFMSLFTKSIYDKWTNSLSSKEIYKFILSNSNHLNIQLKNIDYCVSASNLVSNCPAWLDRNSIQPTSSLKRKKRSVWDNFILKARDETSIWNGEAHCLQSPEEPGFKLGFGKCSFPI